MWGDIIKLSLLGAMFHFAMEYRAWLDWDRKIVFKNRPGPCKTVFKEGGSEDMTHIGDNIVIFTTGIESAVPGFIHALDLNDSSVSVVNITNPPQIEDFLLQPHGVSLWTDPNTGQKTLFVLTHPVKGDRVEVFDVLTPLALKHRKSIADPRFRMMNDLVAIDAERFYITKLLHYKERSWILLEHASRSRFGTVMFYDGHKARDVASNLFMPNGINISPDGQVVYVAEFGGKKLHGYRRDKTNNLAHLWEFDVNTGVDNIDVEADTGNLWLGCHPCMWTRLDWFNWFHITHPSQILYVNMTDNMVDSVSEVYVDDGSEAEGTSVATRINGQVVIGTVADQVVVCQDS